MPLQSHTELESGRDRVALFRQFIVADARRATAEIRFAHHRIAFEIADKPLHAIGRVFCVPAPIFVRVLARGIQQLKPVLDAGIEHRLLVLEIVIERRLRHVQNTRHLVQRGAVIAPFREHMRRRRQHGLALQRALLLAFSLVLPGRCDCRLVHCPSAA